MEIFICTTCNVEISEALYRKDNEWGHKYLRVEKGEMGNTIMSCPKRMWESYRKKKKRLTNAQRCSRRDLRLAILKNEYHLDTAGYI